jgi:hypothetical protein
MFLSKQKRQEAAPNDAKHNSVDIKKQIQPEFSMDHMLVQQILRNCFLPQT